MMNFGDYDNYYGADFAELFLMPDTPCLQDGQADYSLEDLEEIEERDLITGAPNEEFWPLNVHPACPSSTHAQGGLIPIHVTELSEESSTSDDDDYQPSAFSSNQIETSSSSKSANRASSVKISSSAVNDYSNSIHNPIKRKRSRRRQNQLWQFLLETLEDPEYSPRYIQWENKDLGIFRFVESKKVAQLWGERKKRANMSFEYFSRAMRYYYAPGIMRRVCGGRRLIYQFGPNADGWKEMITVREQYPSTEYHP